MFRKNCSGPRNINKFFCHKNNNDRVLRKFYNKFSTIFCLPLRAEPFEKFDKFHHDRSASIVSRCHGFFSTSLHKVREYENIVFKKSKQFLAMKRFFSLLECVGIMKFAIQYE